MPSPGRVPPAPGRVPPIGGVPPRTGPATGHGRGAPPTPVPSAGTALDPPALQPISDAPVRFHPPDGGPPPTHETDSHFRSDVEGLRGLAIALVVAFHAAPTLLPGGFTGVDVFFVISGFVITGLLVRELERRGSIDLPNFYARRVRRLLPAAILALGATLLLSAWILPPLELPRVAGDGVASALSVANIRFALAAGDYFEAVSSPSPFLHYWSLSVEEQFYLVWPATLLIAYRFSHRRSVLAAVVIGIGIASLIAALVLTDLAASWAFYSLPTRAWQLAAGALLAIVALHRARSRGLGLALAIVAWVGFGAVVLGSVMLDESLAYPGTWALIPTLGAAALIAGGDRALSPGVLLRTAPMRFLGRISYALYLWHWPLLVLPVVAYGGELAPATRLALAGIAVAVATLSTVLVEEPIRRGSGHATGRRQALVVGGLGMALLLSMGVGVGAVGFVTDAAIAESQRMAVSGPDDEGSAASDPGDTAEPDELAPEDALIEMGDELSEGADPGSEGGALGPTASPLGGEGATTIDEGPADETPAPTRRPRGQREGPRASPEAGTDEERAPRASDRPERRPRATPRPTPRPQHQPQGRREPPVIRLPGNVKPSVWDAPDDEELLRRNGCLHAEEVTVPRTCESGPTRSRRTIALVGDSHASHWYPALREVANQKGWRLVTFVKVSCPFVDMPVRNLRLKREYRECARFNANAVSALRRLRPDLVVTALSRWQHPTRSGDESVGAQGAALARMLSSVPGRKVVIADVPYPGRDVPSCLSKNIRDVRECAVPSWNRVSGGSPARERMAAKAVKGAFLDFGGVICGGPGTCPVVRGGKIVFRDDHHLTATFARWLAPSMERAITRVLNARGR